MNFGCQSEVGQIKRLLLKHPSDAFISQDNLKAQWQELNYLDCPNYEKSIKEYDYFVSLLEKFIPEIHYLPQNSQTGLDSIYVHDSVLMTSGGAVLCNMGKERRKGEPLAGGEFLVELHIPILGSITGEGKLEGGDVVLFDEHCLAVGQGYRTNSAGIQQLKELTKDFIEDLEIVPLPHWKGPDDVMHLMSIISPIDYDLAVVYSRLMPVPFLTSPEKPQLLLSSFETVSWYL